MTAPPHGTTSTIAEQGRRVAVVTVVLLIVCQSFQALVFGGVALFLPRIREDLGMTFTEAGTLSAATTFTYAMMQIPAGYLVDRFGPRRLFFIGVVGTNVLGITFASLDSFSLMVLNQAVAGFFRSLLFAPGLVLIASWFPPNRRATAMGLYVSGGFTSNILLNLVGPLLAEHFGWRMPFFLFSSIGLVMAMLYLRFARDRAGTATHGASVREALSLFRYRVMWVIGGIQYIRLAVVASVAFWMPTFLVEERGFSLQTTGFLIALGAVLTVPANFLGGYVSDRLRNPLLVIGGSLTVLAVTTALFVVVESTPFLVAAMCVNSVFVQFYFGALFAVPMEFLGPRRAGISSGFSNFFANVGGFSFSYAIGFMKDQTGSFSIGFYALTACCLVGIALTLLLAWMRRRWTPPPEFA